MNKWKRFKHPEPTGTAKKRHPVSKFQQSSGHPLIESMNSVIRQVCRNVKRWRDARMALRWTAAGMVEAKKRGRRRIKDCKQLPILKQALIEHRQKDKPDHIKNAA